MGTIFRPLYQDPFEPVLLNSPVFVVTDEQKKYIREILSISSSDEQFADKAYRAIHRILTGGSAVIPIVTSLTPNAAEIGDPSFTLHVHGTGFTSGSIIIFNGGEELTTFVGPTELTTTVNMDTVSGPFTVPVAVQSVEGILSNPYNFAFTDGTPASLSASKSSKQNVFHEEKPAPHASIPHKK